MKRANADPNGKKPTVAQAKAVWDAEIEPTLDKVFVKLHAAGFTGMAFSTLQRWRAGGWRHHKIPTPEQATQAKKVMAEVKGTEPLNSAEPDDEADLAKLKELALPSLAELATQEALIAQVMLSRRVQRRADILVTVTPKGAAEIITALKGPTSSVTVIMPDKPVEQPQPVGGKMIEHDASERPLTPLQSSIREFRQTMKVVK